jgi:ADP-heptose:LPS heptosyltransferase
MASRVWSRPVVFALAGARMALAALPGRRRVRREPPRRILIAHHLLLGDTIMLTPLIAKCRARWPEAEIVMSCPIPFVGLYSGRPYGVRALPYDPRDIRTLAALRAAAPYDLALVPADNRVSWLARALGAAWIVAFAGDRPPYKDWPIDELRPYPRTPHAWGDLAAGLVDGAPPAPFREFDWPVPSAAAIALPAAPYCVLHAGASTPLKQWPAARWRSLAERLAQRALTVVLCAGPGEGHLLDAIDPQHRWPRYAGTLSLGELWQLLAGAALLVCPDTGVAHLARLTGTPTVALFGPGSVQLSGAGAFWAGAPFTALTIPDFPCRDQRIVMRREVAWVRRCGRLHGAGPGRCAQPRCMEALSEDMVWQAVVARLGGA